MCILSEIVTNVNTYNLKHVTLSTGLLLIVRRGGELLLAVPRIIFFCLLTANDHTVVCRPSEEAVQVLRHSAIVSFHFPLAESR